MRNEDNDCIRYLMKEMDPSEELLMERAMMEDENLLIEVESMRQTLQKLDKLPSRNPSSELTNRILEQAADHAKKSQKDQKPFSSAYRYAVAATLALTLTAGGTWFFIGSQEANTGQQGTSSAGTTPSQAQLSPSSGTEGLFLESEEMTPYQTVTAESQDPEIDPWIDRNDVLQFEEQIVNNNSDFNALLEQSTQKLKLINNTTINRQPVQSIQLTGN